MTQVSVFVKRNGILVPCRSHLTPDGCFWCCGLCNTIVIRASFGVMNGLWRCVCGEEVVLFLDGKIIDIVEMNDLQHGQQPEPVSEAVGDGLEMNDEDFLRELGIAPDLATRED